MLEFCAEQGDRTSVLSLPPASQADDLTFEYIGQSTSFPKRPLRRILAAACLIFPLPETLRLKIINWVHGLRQNPAFADRIWKRLIVHDLELLPLSLELARGAPVYFDAREFYPRQNEESWLFRTFEMPTRQWLCARYLPRCRAIFTVSNGLRQCYRADFGVEATLLRSVPNRQALQPRPVDPNRIRLVHHGVANANRGLTQLIEMTALLEDRFTLDLYLTGKPVAIRRLKKIAARYPKVSIQPPIPLKEIIPILNAYDIGIAFFPPLTLNLKYCLPNKFFEFIQARLALAVGPSPDMADLVQHYDFGRITRDFDFSSLAQSLNAWDADAINQAKHRSHRAASELCFEEEKQKIAAVWQATEGTPESHED